MRNIGHMTRPLAASLVMALSATAATAQPIVDQTGLEPGQFVWQPSLAPDGPVLMVVSLGAKLVHVYRNGAPIGFSKFAVIGKPPQPGIFQPTENTTLSRPGLGTGRLTWSNTPLTARRSSAKGFAKATIAVPDDFATLVAELPHPPTAIVVADERNRPSEIAPRALPASIRSMATPTGRQQHAALGLGNQSDANPTNGVARVSVIISRADARAFIIRDGVVAAVAKASIRNPAKAIGTHVLSLLDPGAQAQDSVRWMAFATAAKADGAPLPSMASNDGLERVSLGDFRATAGDVPKLGPGTVVVLMDSSSPVQPPRVDRLPAANIESLPAKPTATRATKSRPRAARLAADEGPLFPRILMNH